MKTRLDFVSNSSSSSYIISTSKSIQELAAYIAVGAYDFDGYGDVHDPDGCSYPAEVQEFLENNIGYSTCVLFGHYRYLDEKFGTEKFDYERSSIYNVVVENDRVKDLIENGVVKTDFETFKKLAPSRGCGCYQVYEITKDTIAYTKWFISHCKDQKKLNDVFNSLETWKHKDSDGNYDFPPLTEEEKKRYDEVCAEYRGSCVSEGYDVYNQETQKYDEHPIEELLAKFEKDLDAGKKIYRICFGYSGEGTDWDAYIYCDKTEFLNGNADFEFTYDPFW